MNQLYGRGGGAGNTGAGAGATQMGRLVSMLRSTTPRQAKAQIERMVGEGRVTQADLDAAKARATEIAKALGIR